MFLLHVVSHLEEKGVEAYIPLMFYLKSCVLCSLHCEIGIFLYNLIKSWTVTIYCIYYKSKWDCLPKLELWLVFGMVLENQLLPNLMQH